jgi:hypothetical protein
MKNFKPHRGKSGEIYFISKGKDGRDSITFIPAFWSNSEERANKYIDEHYEGDKEKYYYKQQIKEVIRE